MKLDLIKGGLIAGIIVLTTPSFAQKTTDSDKDKNKEDVQQIIITRSGDKEEKTVIEIKGDKITVNGKDAKDANVTVRLNKIKDLNAWQADVENWNFQYKAHDQALSLFSEDANRAMLGIITEESEKGARITSITKESAAEKAGLKKNDIITKIDDQKIETTGDVSKAVRKHKPGEKVTVTYLRDGKEQKITTELGKWKGIKMNAENFHIAIPDRPSAPGAPRSPFVTGYGSTPKLGLSVQDTENGKGVKVTDVEGDGNAGKAGFKENDIITHIDDEAVNSADEIARKVRGVSRDKVSLRFQVLRNNKSQSIEVKIPRKLKTANL